MESHDCLHVWIDMTSKKRENLIEQKWKQEAGYDKEKFQLIILI